MKLDIFSSRVVTAKKCTKKHDARAKVVVLLHQPIECFHSRGQHLCKCFGTKEIICIRKEFISHRIGLGHQHGRRFIVLGHQYGRRDVMWKHSITFLTFLLPSPSSLLKLPSNMLTVSSDTCVTLHTITLASSPWPFTWPEATVTPSGCTHKLKGKEKK